MSARTAKSSLVPLGKPFVNDPDFVLYVGDVRDVLAQMPDESVDCCVTSPPYWGLRDYGVEGQIGSESTPTEFVEVMVAVFREVRRILRPAGTLWLNLGDSYAGGGCGARDPERWPKQSRNDHMPKHVKASSGLPSKGLVGIPWRVALALQDDGWILRSDIVWHKPSPMPESVTDRPTKAHEYVFFLTKQPRYFFDQEAVREPVTGNAHSRGKGLNPKARIHADASAGVKQNASMSAAINELVTSRNIRTVWEIASQPYPEAHFATFPEELPRRCIAAGSPAGGTVLDPFMGSGTTALVARKLGRKAVGVELNPEYAELCATRLAQQSLLAEDAA